MMQATAARQRLRECIERDEIAYLPGVHDALSAKLAVEYGGVEALQHSGYGTAASLLGYPDLNFTSLKETVDVVRNVVRAAGETPVIVDGDTGYGGVATIPHTICEFEATGTAGVFIEDQVTPKKCGLLEDRDLIPAAEMAGKLRAAIDVRVDDSFVVIARTDAYDGHDVDEVVRRGRRYADAGADAFLLGEVAPLEDLETIASRVDVPFYALAIETGETEYETRHPLETYEDAGVDLVSDVGGLLQVSVTVMERYLDAMAESGDHDLDAKPMNELSVFLGAGEYEAFEVEHGP